MRRMFFWLLGGALFLGALVLGWRLAAANATPVDLDMIGFMIVGLAVWQLALGAIALGAGGVMIAASVLAARGWLLRRRYRGTIRRLESELHQLRSLPLAGKDEASAAPESHALPDPMRYASSPEDGG